MTFWGTSLMKENGTDVGDFPLTFKFGGFSI